LAGYFVVSYGRVEWRFFKRWKYDSVYRGWNNIFTV
jgi:hypothetical protein